MHVAASPIYLNVGCGGSAPEGWVNIDSSPTAFVEKLPVIGRTLGKLIGNPEPFPDAVRYGDIIRGRLYGDGEVDAIYASHVLEHLALEDMRRALANLFRMLKPGGVFRVIVPDLRARARLYVERSEAGDPDAANAFIRSTYLGRERRARGPMGVARAMFGAMDHLWMFDDHAMRAELERVGFIDIRPANHGDSGDPMFDRVERADRFTAPSEGNIPEVAFQARKPG